MISVNESFAENYNTNITFMYTLQIKTIRFKSQPKEKYNLGNNKI